MYNRTELCIFHDNIYIFIVIGIATVTCGKVLLTFTYSFHFTYFTISSNRSLVWKKIVIHVLNLGPLVFVF